MSALQGIRALVTSGPTIEPVDPVRFLSNRSSGRQGHAIAEALSEAGAEVTLVSGPVAIPAPGEVTLKRVETAREMLDACREALPVDVAVCVAAVSDWRIERPYHEKLKKTGGMPPVITLVENPDILAELSASGQARPKLVIGFAAETEHMLAHAGAKRQAKGCDWILANDVSGGQGFDAEENTVTLITNGGPEAWPRMSKRAIAEKLVGSIADFFKGEER